MGKWKYYTELLKTAFVHPLGVTSLAAGTIAVVGAAIIDRYPQLETIMSTLLWQIPLAIFVLLALARLVLAPYWMHKKVEKERDELKERAKPRLIIKCAAPANNGMRQGAWGLLVHNQGSDRAEDCRGQLVEMEFANPQEHSTLSNYPMSHSLLWREELAGVIRAGGFNIAGGDERISEIVYWKVVAFGISRLYLAYVGSEEFRHNNTLPVPPEILMVVSVTSKNATPMYAVCLLDEDAVAGYNMELIDVRSERPTIDECRQLLSSHKGETGKQ